MASILLAGGGTAGHVNPLLATAEELRRRGHRVAALGTAEGLEADLVPRAGLDLHVVPRVPMPRRVGADLLRLPWRLRAAVAAASAAIDAVEADAVVGFGGYVSTPAYLAARRRRIPTVIHEANAKPGLANRQGARRAARVAVTFPGTPLPGAVVTGSPLRPEIQELANVLAGERAALERASARASLGWDAHAPSLLVTGGSLGAANLNAATVAAVPALVEQGVHVLHLTGRGKATEAERVHATLPGEYQGRYVVREYAHDMGLAFAAADAVICRAGAVTVSEVSALGLPALYVPLAHGNGEQALNASSAVQVGAAILVPDAALTPDVLRAQALRLVLDAPTRDAMREAVRGIGIRDGAQRLADLVDEALGER